MKPRHRILEEAEPGRIHETALEILSRTGMKVQHPEIRKRLAGLSGYVMDGDRFRIVPEKVSTWMEACAQSRIAPTRNRDSTRGFTCGTSPRPRHIVDRDGTTVRDITRDDVIAGTKLIAQLHSRGVRGCTPGTPTDVPLPLQTLEQFMIGAEYSPAGGEGIACDLATARVLREMNSVYGRPTALSIYCLTPLILGGTELDILWEMRDQVDSIHVGSMPLMGITSPCDPVAAYTVSVTECLGGAAILHDLLPGVPIAIGPHPQPADMGTGTMLFGTPEWELLDLMHREVYAFYGIDWNFKILLTSAPLPGPQACIDHAISATMGFLHGYRDFSDVGELSRDEVFSPAMLMLDLEILGHIERVVAGIVQGEGLGPERLADVIDEAVRRGETFAAHPTTLSNMRSQYYAPHVMRRLTRSQWEAAGRPDAVKEAQAAADRLVETHEYEPPQDVLRELRQIYERARTDLG